MNEQLISPIPFSVPEDKRIDMSLAITTINNHLVDGFFDFDMSNGKINFQLTASYIESILGKNLFDYMLNVSAITVDEYNEKFLLISKGIITLEQFIDSGL